MEDYCFLSLFDLVIIFFFLSSASHSDFTPEMCVLRSRHRMNRTQHKCELKHCFRVLLGILLHASNVCDSTFNALRTNCDSHKKAANKFSFCKMCTLSGQQWRKTCAARSNAKSKDKQIHAGFAGINSSMMQYQAQKRTTRKCHDVGEVLGSD